MEKSIDQLRAEIRYAERLCERTARLYRRVQAIATFLAIVGGSGVLASLAPALPKWLPIAGAILMTLMGAALIASRPAEKVAHNDADAKRYAGLRTKSHGMDAAQLAQALDEIGQSDCPEVEGLRDVAWNDVAVELGRGDAQVSLTFSQKLLSAFA